MDPNGWLKIETSRLHIAASMEWRVSVTVSLMKAKLFSLWILITYPDGIVMDVIVKLHMVLGVINR